VSADFIPFSRPDIGEEEIQAVLESLRSGWITTGPRARQFERNFERYLGGDTQAVAVNSATGGLHLALEALGVQVGDEVIVPTFTFTATAEVVRYLGADPVFVDVDPVTLNVDPRAVAAAITDRTKVIVPVHFAGLPCDMADILAVARAHGVAVVEDAAHAFPARYDGQLIGTLQSDATVFSFYANKTMTTGEGGMVVTRTAGLADRMRTMRLHGIDRDAFDRYTAEGISWFYEVIAPGFKYNLTDIAAAMGIEQLKKIDGFLGRRQELAARYFSALPGLPLVPPAAGGHTDVHAWHLFVVRLAPEARMGRDDLIRNLADRKIATSVHFIPLHRHPYWRDAYGLEAERFPNAEAAYHSVLTLPLYTRLSDDDQDRILRALTELLGD
jgi:dTDP-4-amino-4,6-dideoxygalactose transaminase